MVTGSAQLDAALSDNRVERIICLTPEGTDRRWWQALCAPGLSLFVGDEKRIFVCPLRRAADAAQKARHEGYRPIFFLPYRGFLSELSRSMKTVPFSVMVYSIGYDDEEMRFLLHHPAREVLDALAAGLPIRYPSDAFRDALKTWIEKDKVAGDYIKDVREGVLRLEDFTLLGHEEEGEAREARLTASFAYKKDPRILLQLLLYRRCLEGWLEWDAIGSVTFNRKLLRFRGKLLQFQSDSGNWRYNLVEKRDLLAEVAARFDLPEEYGLASPSVLLETIKQALANVRIKLSSWQATLLETLYAYGQEYRDLVWPLIPRPGMATRRNRGSSPSLPRLLAVLPLEDDGHGFALIWDDLPKQPLVIQVTVTLDGEPIPLPAEAVQYSEAQIPIRISLPNDVRWNHEEYRFDRNDWEWKNPQQLMLTLKTADAEDN